MPWVGAGTGARRKFRTATAITQIFNYDLLSAVPANFTVTRASSVTTTRHNASGFVAAVSANQARIDHDPVTMAQRGLLIEGAATNILLNTPAHLTAGVIWQMVRGTITASAIQGPDGTTSGLKLAEDNSNNSHFLWHSESKAASNLAYNVSCYFRAAERSIFLVMVGDGGAFTNHLGRTFNIGTGNITGFSGGSGFTHTSATFAAVGNSWYRLNWNFTSNAGTEISILFSPTTTNGTFSYQGTTGSGIYFWRPQLVQTNEPHSSAIFSDVALQVRDADQISFATAPISGYVQGAGTRAIWLRPGLLTTERQQTFYTESDGSANNRIDVIRNTSQEVHIRFVNGGVTQADLNMGTVASLNTAKLAFGWKSNSFRASLNGGAIVSDSAGTPPTGLTGVDIGRTTAGAEYAQGHISRIKGWNGQLTDAELLNETQLPPSEIVSFPGAVGFGRLATGGRGGVIRHVTNLNDSGVGSFRNAVATAGPATIVFDVGGYIALNSTIAVASNLTIAGETAPAPGICIRNYTLGLWGVNIIMRHIHCRQGQSNAGGDTTDTVSLRAFGSAVPANIIVDHCSFQWAFDENLDISISTSTAGPHDVTFMNCAFLEGLGAAGGSTGGFGPANGFGALCGGGERITFYRCAFLYNVDRNPVLDYTANNQRASYEVVNCFNFGNYYNSNVGNAAYSSALQMDVASIANYSPETSATDPQPYMIVNSGGWAATAQARIYTSGNVVGSGRSAFSNGNSYNPVVGSAPISSGISAAVIATADAALQTSIMNNVGSRPNNRDSQMTAVVARVAANNATRQSTVAGYGGYPTIGTGSQVFSEPASPQADDDGDGYTNLEEVLHTRAAALLNP